MRVFRSPESRRRTLLVAVGLFVAFAGASVLVREYAPFLTDGAELRAFVAGYGPLAPLVFVAIQAAQVVVAPIPGQVIGFAGGYLFGALLGTVYSLVGVALGSSIAFWLSRRYGRPFVEAVVRTDAMDRFDAFVGEAGLPGLFLAFLIPGLPDDLLCFAGGLTDVRLRRLVAVMVVGRTPAYVVVTLSGSSLANGDLRASLVLLAVLVGSAVVGYRRRERILSALERLG
ncbi:TVP38/TMEM64 family protein [Halorubrum halodurans]|uniref:TVP38/TMEM64 family protein n=1 Tax=Halorubrum halodurans TaxID=1383851 RepID=A0A256IC43_9EURY|nr:TVP38/TMEM64 family protein [Halorubrum halodurans]OYR54124.1 TVP38/TMEM64 family protein [Halorubrum halodurans]